MVSPGHRRLFGAAVQLALQGCRLLASRIGVESLPVGLKVRELGQLAHFPHLQAYWQRLNTHPARQKAAALERELDQSAE